eukprot:g9138.t1
MAQDWAAYAAALQALAPAQMGLTGQAAPAAPTLPSLPAVAQHPPAAPLADAATIAAAVALLQPQIAGGAGYGALRSAHASCVSVAKSASRTALQPRPVFHHPQLHMARRPQSIHVGQGLQHRLMQTQRCQPSQA